MTDYIPQEELVVRGVYKLHARNLLYGVWTGERWIGIRDKFGLFLDECEVPYHTAFPMELVETLPDEIEVKSRLPTQCEVCGDSVHFETDDAAKHRYRGVWQHTNQDFDQHKVKPISLQYQPLFDYLMKFQVN